MPLFVAGIYIMQNTMVRVGGMDMDGGRKIKNEELGEKK